MDDARMSNVKDAPLFLTPQVVRGIITPAPAKGMANIPFDGFRLVDEVRPDAVFSNTKVDTSRSALLNAHRFQLILKELHILTSYPIDDILNSKARHAVEARQALWLVLHKIGLTGGVIARLSKRDPSSVSCGIKIAKQRMINEDFQAIVNHLVDFYS